MPAESRPVALVRSVPLARRYDRLDSLLRPARGPKCCHLEPRHPTAASVQQPHSPPLGQTHRQQHQTSYSARQGQAYVLSRN